MCGIAGYITTDKTDNKRINAFKALLIANSTRGNESAGVYLYNSDLIIKKAVSPVMFINEHLNLKNELINGNKIVIGHTRLATTGSVSDDNSHPFRYGDIVGVHNGIVSNHYEINKDLKVDSECIFYLLDKHRPKSYKAFNRLSGMYAIAYTDNKDNLNLVRHNNPLSVAVVDNTIFFNSEYYTLASVLYSAYGKVDSIEELKEDTLYTYNKDLTVIKREVSFKEMEYTWNKSKGKYKGLYSDTYEDIAGYDYSSSGDQFSSYLYETFDELMTESGCEICQKTKTHGYLDVTGQLVYCNKCIKRLPKWRLKELVKID